MTTREKMVKFRESKGLDIRDMAYRCRIGPTLMEILEEGGVTTPKLVPQIAEQYGLTELEAEDLMPEHMRPHGPDYDPDRYVIQDYPKQPVIVNEDLPASINDIFFDKTWKAARNKRLYDDRLSGMTFQQLGEKYKISWERARDICHRVENKEQRRQRWINAREKESC